MIKNYLLSMFAGCLLGAGHGIVFFRGHNTSYPPGVSQPMGGLAAIGMFLFRYVVLFTAFLFLCSVVHLNLYIVVLFFFLAFWGYIIFKVKRGL